MNKLMRILIFYDLPVHTRAERKAASGFRSALLKDGYLMVQHSVYARVCSGIDAVEKHRARVCRNLPDHGAVRMLVVTEKQFEAIEILLGGLSQADDPSQYEQFSIF